MGSLPAVIREDGCCVIIICTDTVSVTDVRVEAELGQPSVDGSEVATVLLQSPQGMRKA